MKIKLRIVLSVLWVAALVSCKSGGAEGKGMYGGALEPEVEKLLGGKDIYGDAQRVIPVLVNSETGSGEKKENLEGYAITRKGNILSPEQQQRLQAVIFNAGTYDFKTSKRCPFRPYVGFIFEKSGKQAHALFCFSCNEVSFGRDSKQGNIEDFDAARKEILALSREAFPGDAALSKLGDSK